MTNTQTQKLGDVSAITIRSSDLDTSLKYYQQLDCTELYHAYFPFPWIPITDGVLLIMLPKDENPYIVLTYYPKEIDNVVVELKPQGGCIKKKCQHLTK